MTGTIFQETKTLLKMETIHILNKLKIYNYKQTKYPQTQQRKNCMEALNMAKKYTRITFSNLHIL